VIDGDVHSVPANAPARSYLAWLKNVGVVRWLEPSWQRSRRRHIERRRRTIVERLVRAFFVVLSAKAIESRLLLAKRPRRGPQRFLFEGPMHALVSPVLLGVTRLNAFVTNAELHPPNGELRQPTSSSTGKRSPVVRANPFW
jgi:hypothetical protein